MLVIDYEMCVRWIYFWFTFSFDLEIGKSPAEIGHWILCDWMWLWQTHTHHHSAFKLIWHLLCLKFSELNVLYSNEFKSRKRKMSSGSLSTKINERVNAYSEDREKQIVSCNRSSREQKKTVRQTSLHWKVC